MFKNGFVDPSNESPATFMLAGMKWGVVAYDPKETTLIINSLQYLNHQQELYSVEGTPESRLEVFRNNPVFIKLVDTLAEKRAQLKFDSQKGDIERILSMELGNIDLMKLFARFYSHSMDTYPDSEAGFLLSITQWKLAQRDFPGNLRYDRIIEMWEFDALLAEAGKKPSPGPPRMKRAINHLGDYARISASSTWGKQGTIALGAEKYAESDPTKRGEFKHFMQKWCKSYQCSIKFDKLQKTEYKFLAPLLQLYDTKYHGKE